MLSISWVEGRQNVYSNHLNSEEFIYLSMVWGRFDHIYIGRVLHSFGQGEGVNGKAGA